MTLEIDTSLKRDFARSIAFRREQELFTRRVDRRREETRESAKADDDIADLATSVVLASDVEIAEFQAELEVYHAATTEALLDNEQRLVAVQAELDAMLAQAYVLPDGRRVFKTKDGLRVFDEHGTELSCDDVDPDMVEEWRPHAEAYLERYDVKNNILTERERLLTFEEQIRRANERAESGELSKDELSDLRDELADSAPEIVRHRVLGDNYRPPINLGQQFGAAVAKAGVTTPKLTAEEISFDH